MTNSGASDHVYNPGIDGDLLYKKELKSPVKYDTVVDKGEAR
jgi:hypothetical protein